MATTVLTQKCQTTVPQAVREDLGVGPGSRIEWVKLPNGGYTIVPINQSVRRLRGSRKWHGQTVSIEQMESDIATAVAEACR